MEDDPKGAHLGWSASADHCFVGQVLVFRLELELTSVDALFTSISMYTG